MPLGGIPCPAAGIVTALAIAPLLGLSDTQRGLLILFGALPPAVLNFLVAEQFKQEPAKVASIVLIGNVLSVVFVPIVLAYSAWTYWVFRKRLGVENMPDEVALAS